MASPDGQSDRVYAEIVVVRHGETSWNASKILQGHLDVELSETGKKQAHALAQRLSREQSFAAVYSSDLKRAAETAHIISNGCNAPDVIHLSELRERNLGDLQGMTLKDAAMLKSKAYNDLLSYNSNQEISGGGESLDQLHRRCTSAMEIIARKHKGERVLVVSHGGVIRELYKRACPRSRPPGKIANVSVNVFCISSDGNDWKIRSWGDISHLNKTEFLKDSFGGDRTSG